MRRRLGPSLRSALLRDNLPDRRSESMDLPRRSPQERAIGRRREFGIRSDVSRKRAKHNRFDLGR